MSRSEAHEASVTRLTVLLDQLREDGEPTREIAWLLCEALGHTRYEHSQTAEEFVSTAEKLANGVSEEEVAGGMSEAERLAAEDERLSVAEPDERDE